MSRPERSVLLPAAMSTVVAGACCTTVAAFAVGRHGAGSAVLATALVLAFLLLGQLPVAQASRGRQGLGAALLLGGYTARIALVLFAFRLFHVADGVDREVLGLTVVATALAWTAGAVWAFLRWKPLYVEPEADERSQTR
jgi:ATP synthase protein I